MKRKKLAKQKPKQRRLPPGIRMLDGGKAGAAQDKAKADPAQRDTRAKHLACPRGMTRPQQKVFRAIVKHLAGHHMLNNADAPVLRQYAEVMVRRREAVKIVADDGMMVQSSTGSRIRHPMLITIEKCDSQLVSIFKELGLTPGARARRGQS